MFVLFSHFTVVPSLPTRSQSLNRRLRPRSACSLNLRTSQAAAVASALSEIRRLRRRLRAREACVAQLLRHLRHGAAAAAADATPPPPSPPGVAATASGWATSGLSVGEEPSGAMLSLKRRSTGAELRYVPNTLLSHSCDGGRGPLSAHSVVGSDDARRDSMREAINSRRSSPHSSPGETARPASRDEHSAVSNRWRADLHSSDVLPRNDQLPPSSASRRSTVKSHASQSAASSPLLVSRRPAPAVALNGLVERQPCHESGADHRRAGDTLDSGSKPSNHRRDLHGERTSPPKELYYAPAESSPWLATPTIGGGSDGQLQSPPGCAFLRPDPSDTLRPAIPHCAGSTSPAAGSLPRRELSSAVSRLPPHPGSPYSSPGRIASIAAEVPTVKCGDSCPACGSCPASPALLSAPSSPTKDQALRGSVAATHEFLAEEPAVASVLAQRSSPPAASLADHVKASCPSVASANVMKAAVTTITPMAVGPNVETHVSAAAGHDVASTAGKGGAGLILRRGLHAGLMAAAAAGAAAAVAGRVGLGPEYENEGRKTPAWFGKVRWT